MEYKCYDGWDKENIPPLQEFMSAYDCIYHEVYELRNCKRTISLLEMRDILKQAVERMNVALTKINDDDLIVEIKEEEE